MSSSRSYYEILGVPQSADAHALRKAFRHLSKALHPDTTSLPEEEASIGFQEVCEAYEFLIDPLKRDAYDASLSVNEYQANLSSERHENNFNLTTEESRFVEFRRPFSGGELFSLLLLGIAFIFSLALGLGIAISHGREFHVSPSWLVIEQTINQLHIISF